MSFDPKTAKPLARFDPSSAKPFESSTMQLDEEEKKQLESTRKPSTAEINNNIFDPNIPALGGTKEAPIQFPGQVVQGKQSEARPMADIALTNQQREISKNIPQAKSLSEQNPSIDAFYEAKAVVNATDTLIKGLDAVVSGQVNIGLNAPISIARSALQGVIGGANEYKEAIKTAASGELKDLPTAIFQALNAGTTIAFSAAIPFSPELQAFTGVSQIAEQLAPKATELLTAPVETLAKPETKLGKAISKTADTVINLFEAAYGAKLGKALLTNFSSRGSIPESVLQEAYKRAEAKGAIDTKANEIVKPEEESILSKKQEAASKKPRKNGKFTKQLETSQSEVVKPEILPNAEQQTSDLPTLSEVQNATIEGQKPKSNIEQYPQGNESGQITETSNRNQSIESGQVQETQIDNNANAIQNLVERKPDITPEEISKVLNIPVEEVTKQVNVRETTPDVRETPIVEQKPEATQPIENIEQSLKPEIQKRFISDESYQTAKENLRSKGMQLNVGLDPTILKDFTVIGAYHLENIARAGIEKGKEFQEFSKRMIEELGQEVKPHLQRIYNSTIKEHQKTLEELRTLPEGTKGKPNLHFSGVDERIKPEIESFYESHKPEYDQVRGGKIGNKQLINKGLQYASKLTDEDVLSIKSKKGIGEVEAVGSHIYGQHRIEQLINEMDKVKLGTPEGFKSRKAKADLAAEMFYNIELPYSKAGRQLQIKGKLATDNFIDALRKLRDEAQTYDPKLAQELTEKLKGAEYEPTLKDKITFWYYNSLLSDPTTDIRNITGNTTMLGSELLSKTFSQSPKETIKMMADVGRGMKAGLKEMSDIYNQRVTEDSKFINTVNRYDIKAKTEWGKFGRALLPTTRLSMEDAFFRGIAREMATGKVERVSAKKFGESLIKTKEQIDKVNKGDLDNLTEDQIKFMADGLEYIEKYIDYTTFRTELGKTASAVESIVRNNWGAKIIMPFVKIGANIIKAGTDYSPLGFGKEAIARMSGKEINPFELKDIRRRAIAGTLAMGIIIDGVANGFVEVTGQLPKDTFEREAMQAKGYQPNHFYLNFGGKKIGISYQNINPINIALSIMGNYSDNLRFGKDIQKTDELSFGDKLGKTILGSAATLADQSYMQGISNLIDALNKQDPSYFSDIVVGFIPNITGLPKKIIGDNTSYKTKTFGEKIQRKIGITEGLEPNIDIKGEEKKSQIRGLPLPISEVKEDKLLDFLKEKDLRISLPSPNTKSGDDKLTPEQYTAYQKIVNKNVYNRLTRSLSILKLLNVEKAQDLINEISDQEKKNAKRILNIQSSNQNKPKVGL